MSNKKLKTNREESTSGSTDKTVKSLDRKHKKHKVKKPHSNLKVKCAERSLEKKKKKKHRRSATPRKRKVDDVNMLYDQPDVVRYKTLGDGRKIIEGATLSVLVRKLISENDAEFEGIFLFCYKVVSTPNDVVKKIIWYLKGLDRTDPLFDVVFNRSIDIMLIIVDESYSALSDDVILGITDLKSIIEPYDKVKASTLRDTMLNHMMGTKKKILPKEIPISPPPIYPTDWENFTLKDLSPTEVARQLCLMDFEIYKNIKKLEYLSTESPKKSPHITLLRTRAKLLTRFVLYSIISDVRDARLIVYTKWIKIAYILFNEMQNFNSSVAIISGLLSTPILNFGLLEKSRHKDLLEGLIVNIDLDNNYTGLKIFQDKLFPPCIPYIDVYIEEILNTPSCISNDMGSEEETINFVYYRMIYGILKKAFSYQNTEHAFEMVKIIQDYLTTCISESADYEDQILQQMSVSNTKYKVSYHDLPSTTGIVTGCIVNHNTLLLQTEKHNIVEIDTKQKHETISENIVLLDFSSSETHAFFLYENQLVLYDLGNFEKTCFELENSGEFTKIIPGKRHVAILSTNSTMEVVKVIDLDENHAVSLYNFDRTFSGPIFTNLSHFVRNNLIIGRKNGIVLWNLTSQSIIVKHSSGSALEPFLFLNYAHNMLVAGTIRTLYIFNLHAEPIPYEISLAQINSPVTCCYPHNSGLLVLGTFDGSVGLANLETILYLESTNEKKQIKEFTLANAKEMDKISNLHCSKDGRFIVATQNSRITLYTFEHDAIIKVNSLTVKGKLGKSRLLSNLIIGAVTTSDGTLQMLNWNPKILYSGK